MNCRSLLTMMAVGVIGFCANSTARADEVVKFRMFMHATSVQSQEVGDVDGHLVLLFRYSGLALFSDGSVSPANFTGTAEYTKGVGTFSTYFSVSPKDSTLWIKVAGTAKPEGTTTVFPEASAIVLGGSGRFAGAKGDGTFVGGVRLTPPAAGAELWNEFVINVKN